MTTTTQVIRHAVTPHDARAVAAMANATAAVKGTLDSPAARGAFDDVMGHTPPAAGVTYEEATVGGVPGWWCRPANAHPDVATVHLHGGAYILGSARAYRHFVGQLAARTRVATFIPDYRLAPEHRFPAAIDDALAVYRGLGTARRAITGDSAGGGLALALALRLRDGAAPAPSVVVAFSPWADLAVTGASHTSRAEADPLLTRAMLATTAALYLGDHEPRDPLASPIYGDLAGLPPIQLHVGDREVLLDDALTFGRRAAEAGVDATVHVWDGLPHVFPASIGVLDAAPRALDLCTAFLDKHLALGMPGGGVVPADDPTRTLAVVDPDDPALAHIAMVGDTYTILLSGAQTNGRYCLIDMAVPACGGPGPHRHDFEEMFTVLEGEIEMTFRGEKHRIRAGMTINVPANAPHFFTNVAGVSARMLCMCTPALQDDFFLAVGAPVASRTATAPKPTGDELHAFIARATTLAPAYRTELLPPPAKP